MKVPFNQIAQNYKENKTAIDAIIQEVLSSGQYIGGEAVENFQKAFATYHQARFAIGCANGTDALYLALKALDLGPGDEVLTTAYSWIATAMAISQTGATPVFVDVEAEYLQMDLAIAEKFITERTKALLPVYLYGDIATRDSYLSFARKHQLAIIEDAAQVHGISLSMDQGIEHHLACFSFYPTKQLGAVGDAGAVSTNNKQLADRVQRMAHLGATFPAQDFQYQGINSRLDPIQAGVLTTKLKRIDSQFARRHALASIYDQKLDGNYQKPKLSESHTLYQYVIRTRDRASVRKALSAAAIGFGCHYEFTIPGTIAYGSQTGFPMAEKASQEVISLPIDPSLTEDQIDYVCQVLNDLIS